MFQSGSGPQFIVLLRRAILQSALPLQTAGQEHSCLCPIDIPSQIKYPSIHVPATWGYFSTTRKKVWRFISKNVISNWLTFMCLSVSRKRDTYKRSEEIYIYTHTHSHIYIWVCVYPGRPISTYTKQHIWRLKSLSRSMKYFKWTWKDWIKVN